MKALAAQLKRQKTLTNKLKVQFSRLGGPCGDNERSFVDEVIMYTRRQTPLIGVKRWKLVGQHVKNFITQAVMVCYLPPMFSCLKKLYIVDDNT